MLKNEKPSKDKIFEKKEGVTDEMDNKKVTNLTKEQVQKVL
jgi:hypothetical protein